MGNRIEIANQYWTPFRNEVFKETLSGLAEKCAAAVYLFLYDNAYHDPSKRVAATLRQLAEWVNTDERVVRTCLEELRVKGFARKVTEGVLRSRVNLDVWEVPLATFDLTQEQWTPVPRVLIQKYLPAFAGSPLLPMLLYHQHLSWNNICWPGVTTLSKRLNWSATRVNDSLRTMFDPDTWYSRYPELQRPLRCIPVKTNGKWRRRFRVRAVYYDRSGRKPIVRISTGFQKAFYRSG
jgi:hypothetical protein